MNTVIRIKYQNIILWAKIKIIGDIERCQDGRLCYCESTTLVSLFDVYINYKILLLLLFQPPSASLRSFHLFLPISTHFFHPQISFPLGWPIISIISSLLTLGLPLFIFPSFFHFHDLINLYFLLPTKINVQTISNSLSTITNITSIVLKM